SGLVDRRTIRQQRLVHHLIPPDRLPCSRSHLSFKSPVEAFHHSVRLVVVACSKQLFEAHLLSETLEFDRIKLGSVIGHDLLWNAKSVDDRLTYPAADSVRGASRNGLSFWPLRESVLCHKNVAVARKRRHRDRPDDID